MNKNQITYFTDANTSSGYRSFLNKSFYSCKNRLILKNTCRLFRKNLFDKLISQCDACNTFYHKILHPGYSDYMCGSYLPEKDTLIYCTPFFEIPAFSTDEAYVLSDSCRSELKSIENDVQNLKKQMYFTLNSAKQIHDEWEKIYISNMDFTKADKAADEIISGFFKKHNNRNCVNIDRFFGSMLPIGSVNYIDNITNDIENRIFIKGRPGTGKSTFLKKIRSAALSNGFNTETYYCSFDPKSLDMLIIRDLSVCLFDSTPPHEMFPERKNDRIVDLYEIAVEDGTDEKYCNETANIKLRYDIEMSRAKNCLSDILKKYDEADALVEKNTANDDTVIGNFLYNIFN